jgi:hypothetical protein
MRARERAPHTQVATDLKGAGDYEDDGQADEEALAAVAVCQPTRHLSADEAADGECADDDRPHDVVQMQNRLDLVAGHVDGARRPAKLKGTHEAREKAQEQGARQLVLHGSTARALRIGGPTASKATCCAPAVVTSSRLPRLQHLTLWHTQDVIARRHSAARATANCCGRGAGMP